VTLTCERPSELKLSGDRFVSVEGRMIADVIRDLGNRHDTFRKGVRLGGRRPPLLSGGRIGGTPDAKFLIDSNPTNCVH